MFLLGYCQSLFLTDLRGQFAGWHGCLKPQQILIADQNASNCWSECSNVIFSSNFHQSSISLKKETIYSGQR